jgi:hypothetical protein
MPAALVARGAGVAVGPAVPPVENLVNRCEFHLREKHGEKINKIKLAHQRVNSCVKDILGPLQARVFTRLSICFLI